MKILFTRFPLESAFGGAEVQTMSLMRQLKGRGHEISFIGSCPVLLELCREHGIPAIHVNIGEPPVTKWGAVSFLWRKQAMQRRLQECWKSSDTVDAVVMLSLSEKLLLTPTARQKNVDVYWLEHDRVGRWLKHNPWLSRLRKLSTDVTTICVSKLSAQLYINLGWTADKVIAIPNGIDPHRFSVQPSERQKTDKLTIGCIARLTSDKGIDLLLRAVENVPNIHLEIVGEGREETELKRQIVRRGLTDRVNLLPRHEDLGQFYQAIDVLVLPSRDHDPFGLVAAEAMLLGTPAIVTDACGIADYLTNAQDALIVPAGSATALQEALETLQDSATRERLAEAGKQTVQNTFLMDQMVNQYEQLFSA